MKKISILIAIIAIVGLLGIRVITGRQGVSEASVAKSSLLGISVRDIAESERSGLGTDNGALIAAVHANSIAEQYGFQPDDLIQAINDESVKNQSDYHQILDRALMQKMVIFRVKRASGEVKIRLNMEYAPLYSNLGNAYVKDGEYDKAVEAYQKAISIDPNFAEVYYNMGSVYEKQKKYDMAIDNYKKAIDGRENFQEAYHRLAEVYKQQGRHQDAIQTYKNILPSSPSDTIASDLRPVEVIRAAQGKIKNELKFSGTIEARARVAIFPKVVGVIEEMKVDQGNIVQEDQILAVVEHEELELQFQQAEAVLEAAQAGYGQTKQLAKTRVMSQVTQARAGLEAAEAALQQVRDLAETRAVTQIQQARSALDALTANLEKIRRGARKEEREQIQATVMQAEASLANAQNSYERMKRLFEEGAISEQTYEGVQTQLDVAKAQYRTAQQQWEMVKEGARQEDIDAMEAQVKQAQAAFNLAQKQAEKQTWQKDIAMAEAQAQQARAALESAETMLEARSWEAEIIAAETQVTQARTARDLSCKRLADAYIRAPVSGVISVRYLDQGSMVTAAAPLFEIVDMDVVYAKVDVMESDLGKIRMGATAWINVAALDAPVKSLVTSISPVLDESSRTAQVEVSVENPEHLLKPGMFAQVLLPTDVRPDAVLLPRSAVIEDENDKKYVFIVNSGKSRKIPVEYGLTKGNLVEIARGVDPGAMVVFSGQRNLKDGDFVQVVNVIEGL